MATNKDIIEKLQCVESRLTNGELEEIHQTVKEIKEVLLDPEDGIIVRVNKNTYWRRQIDIQDIKELDKWCYAKGRLILCSDATETDDPVPVKEVYKTFKEINQLELVRQAGIRQQYVDQAVSLNLAFPKEATPKWINQVHLEAWKAGVKTLYYFRTESVLRGDIAANAMKEDCAACEGKKLWNQ